jgi:hypothetical protein
MDPDTAWHDSLPYKWGREAALGAARSSGTSLPRLSATEALVAVAHWWHPTGPSPRGLGTSNLGGPELG